MKKYMATENEGFDSSTAHIRRTFRACIENGRRSGGREGADLWEAYRLMGTGLHTSKSLGFLNPLLYDMAEKSPSTFHDITVGNNNWYCQFGFKAQKGWDPVSGLGSPNFAEIYKYIKRVKKF